MTSSLSNNTPSKNENYLTSIIIIGVLFFIFGFVTWLNGTLIPYLKIACELNNFQAYFVATAFYISYFVMALPSSWVLKKTGFKRGMSLGLVVMAIGSLVFIPAAMTRMYGLFLTGLFIQGTGLSILQTASNPYITIIGPMESAAKRIGIMGICNKVAGVLSPLILGAVVLKNADQIVEGLKTVSNLEKMTILNDLASRVIFPYVIIASVLVILAILLLYTKLPEIEMESETNVQSTDISDKKSIFDFPHLWLGAIALFVYVGVEVIAGDTIINYGKYMQYSFDEAKTFTSYTLAAMVIGYILGIIAIPKYIKQQKALQISAIIGISLSLVAIFSSGFISVASIALLGIANAMMWPAIWPLAITGLGKFTKTGSALLIMGIAGGAILPLAYGKLADILSPQLAYWVAVPCYLFIFYYAFHGHKIRK